MFFKLLSAYKTDLSKIVQMFSPENLNDFLTANSTDVVKGILDSVWQNAPESGLVHLIPAWDILCQLRGLNG
jgi:hypothetical protein